jgi:hypothetical protein
MKIKFKIKNRVMMILDNNQTILGSESADTRKTRYKTITREKKQTTKEKNNLSEST